MPTQHRSPRRSSSKKEAIELCTKPNLISTALVVVRIPLPAFACTPAPARSTINDRDIDNYFGLETLKLIVRSPLVLLGLEGKYDIVVRVAGGGVSGQAGAIRHGLSRALLQQSDENRPLLKKAGFLTCDPRMKERKKYGLKAARRAPQFSKR